MKIDTEALFHKVNADLAQVQRVIEDGMFPQVREEQYSTRHHLRNVKDALLLVERYAAEASS